MFLIIGLGNPGEEYSKNRHNVGFLMLDTVFGDAVWRKDAYAKALVYRGDFALQNVVCAKPTTFMNNSGDTVQYLLGEERIAVSEMIVIYDDIDLPLGTVRVSYDRGDGGHNGLKSIVATTGSTEFTRIRVGIAPVDDDGNIRKPDDTANYVLKNFSSNELEKVLDQKEKVAKAITLTINEGVEKVMNVVNGNV